MMSADFNMINSNDPDLIGLSEDERKKFIAVMKKAKDFEQQEGLEVMRQPIEGQLYKYTNVMKGYQFRWFVLDPETGRLEYYEKEEHKRQKARGYVHLAGAVISPSDEDSQTFNVNASNGDIYRLRAIDARERQIWVNRLRATSEYHTDLLLKSPRDSRMVSGYSGSLDSLNKSSENLSVYSMPATVKLATNSLKSSQNPTNHSSPRKNSPVIIKKRSHRKSLTGSHSNLSTTQFREVKDMLTQVSHQVQTLKYKIEDLPLSDAPHSTDREMLLLKATSSATLGCLDNCLSILQQHNISPLGGYCPPYNGAVVSDVTTGIKPYTVSPVESHVTSQQVPSERPSGPRVNHSDEVQDPTTYHDTDLESIEEHKPVILHLLSQLKLGMDLTKVVLPTFILEKRSLLEMFADCMSHPDLFLSITDQPDPEARMIGVLEWYLTSFHAGRQGCLAKKPYNPIIGETFHCSWREETSNPTTQGTAGTTPGSVPGDPGASDPGVETDTDRQEGLQARLKCDDNEVSGSMDSSGRNLYYTAEQVSHHPPISSFYFESPEARMFMNGSIYTKSKFLGMSIGVSMIGKVQLHLLEHNEVYEFSLPSAYARSILTVPWVEMGDKVSLSCAATGYSASVIFHIKPFYGGRLHKVTSEVKGPSGDVICKVQGEWNKALEFTHFNGETRTIHLASLPERRKCVRPISLQGETESRRLWQAVTTALYKGDIDSATEHKRFLEERQRQGEKHRRENNAAFHTRYFQPEGEGWIYRSCLQ